MNNNTLWSQYDSHRPSCKHFPAIFCFIPLKKPTWFGTLFFMLFRVRADKMKRGIDISH